MRRSKNLKGFTIIETLIAIVILFITVSGVMAASISSLKASRIQKENNLAQRLIEKMVAQEIRNAPFSAKSPSNSLCGDPSLTGSVANQIKTGNVNINSSWEKTFVIASNSTYKDDLAKISPNAKSIIKIRPIIVGGNVSDYAYSTSRVKITISVEWKSGGTSVPNIVEQNTLASDNGIFTNNTSREQF